MSDAIKVVYMIMLKEKVISVWYERKKNCVDLQITYIDEYGSKKYVIMPLEPQ